MFRKCNGPLTILLLALMTSAIRVNALKCYQCRSDLDKNCENEVHQKYLKECVMDESAGKGDEAKPAGEAPAGEAPAESPAASPAALKSSGGFYCRSISQILYLRDNKGVTIRECGHMMTSSDTCYKVSNKLIYRLVCECKAAGCNRSSRVPRAGRTLVLSFITWNILLYVI